MSGPKMMASLVLGFIALAAHAGTHMAALARAGGDAAPITLAELGKLGCAPGLERFLPGVYYYCVGARDLANHRDASGHKSELLQHGDSPRTGRSQGGRATMC